MLLTKFARRLAIGMFLLPLLMGSLFAQGTGTISGRVYDEATGRSLLSVRPGSP